MPGLEEGLFPLSRASETDDGLQEERRLFYVGVTRAQDRLFLMHAGERNPLNEAQAGEIVGVERMGLVWGMA